MANYQVLIADCEKAIRSGGAHRVSSILHELNSSRVPREWILPLARIHRRSGAWKLGLSLLSRVVHSEASPASASERAEYGMLLYRFGATSEAMEWLTSPGTASAPEALHYLGLVELTQWNLQSAIEKFTQYLDTSPDDYSQIVAKTNLALAHIENRDGEVAHRLLDEVIDLAQSEQLLRILNAALSCRSQLAIHNRDFASARRDLEQAQRALELVSCSDRFNSTKLRLILSALEQKSLSPLAELSAIAKACHAWEDVRIADMFSCQIDFEMSRFLKLLFGTPFAGFRDRLLNEFQLLPDRKHFYLGHKDAPRFHIGSGQIIGGQYAVPGTKSLQFIEVMLRDFYQPLRIQGVFSALFPSEHFNLDSSPDRTHQIINRTRRWFKAQEVPLRIFESDGFYSLQIEGDFSFLVPLERKPVDVMSLYFEKLSRLAETTPCFSARQARDQLQVSRHTVQRILSWGLERKLIGKRTEGKDVLYTFIASRQRTG